MINIEAKIFQGIFETVAQLEREIQDFMSISISNHPSRSQSKKF